MPSWTSQVSVHTSSRNHRSWVMTSRPPDVRAHRRLRCSASHEMPSTSRWLVGSSRAMRSHSPTRSAASATRRRWPPESSPTSASHGTSATRPPMTSRTRASPAHSCSGRSPTMLCPTVAVGSRSSVWPRTPKRTPPRRVIRPDCGSMVPASMPSRLDLPSPLRPTSPIRSPSSMPRLTESKTTRVGYSRWSDSAPRRGVAIRTCAPSAGRGHPGPARWRARRHRRPPTR